jgi:hypothetical protein
MAIIKNQYCFSQQTHDDFVLNKSHEHMLSSYTLDHQASMFKMTMLANATQQ